MGDNLKEKTVVLLCVGGILLAWLGSRVHLEGGITAKLYKVIPSDHIYPMMNHFYSDSH